MTKLMLPDLAGTLESAFRVAGISVRDNGGVMEFMDAKQTAFVDVRGKNASFGSTDDDGAVDILHGGTSDHEGRLNFSGGSYLREYEDPLTGGDDDEFVVASNQNFTGIWGQGDAPIAEHFADIGLFSYMDGHLIYSGLLDQVVTDRQFVVNSGDNGQDNAGILVYTQGSSGEALSWYNPQGTHVGGLNCFGNHGGFLLKDSAGNHKISFNASSVASFNVVVAISRDLRLTSGSATNLDALRMESASGSTMGIQWNSSGTPVQYLYKDGGNDLVFFDSRYGESMRFDNTGLRIPSGFASTSTTDGSLVVTGGVGISGALNVGGLIRRGNTWIGGDRLSLSAFGQADTNGGVHIDRAGANGAGTVGGILFAQSSVSDRRIYFTGNDGGFYWRFGNYSTFSGTLQLQRNNVGIGGQLRFSPDEGVRTIRAASSGTGLIIRTKTAISAFAANDDLDAYDSWIRTQDGGDHTSNNPRGGDLYIITGAGGAGGTGRQGRVLVQSDTYFSGDVSITGAIISPLLYRSKVEVVNASGTLALESNKKVIVKTSGITVSLWSIGVQDGDQVFIRNKSGGSITIDTEAGVSPQPTIEGVSSITRNDGEVAFLVFDATANDWTTF